MIDILKSALTANYAEGSSPWVRLPLVLKCSYRIFWETLHTADALCLQVENAAPPREGYLISDTDGQELYLLQNQWGKFRGAYNDIFLRITHDRTSGQFFLCLCDPKLWRDTISFDREHSETD